MTTGHYNPGYGNVVSNLQRARAAQQSQFNIDGHNLKALVHQTPNSSNLDQIRREARDAWLERDCNETSYQAHYNDKFSQVQEIQQTRPSSTGRLNKPHPSMVFLTNRLHYVPGYHNADTTLAKEPYRVDESMTPNTREVRGKLREKFAPIPSSPALNQYQTDEELERLVSDPYHRQGCAAAMRITNERENILGKLRELNVGEDRCTGAFERSYRPRTVASLHRYLKPAGVEEANYLNSLYNKHILGTDNDYVRQTSGDARSRRRLDINRARNVTLRNCSATKRGDFLMRPEWPPSFSAHRLNGLSSVDGQHTWAKVR